MRTAFNGVVTTYGYDALNRLTASAILLLRNDGGGNLQRISKTTELAGKELAVKITLTRPLPARLRGKRMLA